MSNFILESIIAIEFHLVRQKNVTTNLLQNSFQNQGQTLKNYNSQYTIQITYITYQIKAQDVYFHPVKF